MIIVDKTVYGAPGEAMYSERWRDVPDSDSAMSLMKSSQYAYLAATQTMLRELSKIFSEIWKQNLDINISEATGDLCNIIEMGPNLFTGQHVIAWKKNFVYGPLLDYK